MSKKHLSAYSKKGFDKLSYYRTCPRCKATLTSGEDCHCMDVIKVERSPEFTAIANRVSDCLTSLPLTNDQHNRLVALIIEQLREAESTALRQGFSLGVKAAKHFEKRPEKEEPPINWH